MSFFMAKDARAALGNDAERCKNPALFASKFPDLAKDEADKESKKRSLERLIKLPSDEQGRKARLTFFKSLGVCGFPCATFTADLRGRLIVNQAGGVLENAGLCLDRHFGIPYIPG